VQRSCVFGSSTFTLPARSWTLDVPSKLNRSCLQITPKMLRECIAVLRLTTYSLREYRWNTADVQDQSITRVKRSYINLVVRLSFIYDLRLFNNKFRIPTNDIFRWQITDWVGAVVNRKNKLSIVVPQCILDTRGTNYLPGKLMFTRKCLTQEWSVVVSIWTRNMFTSRAKELCIWFVIFECFFHLQMLHSETV
jgi:hexokinase